MKLMIFYEELKRKRPEIYVKAMIKQINLQAIRERLGPFDFGMMPEADVPFNATLTINDLTSHVIYKEGY